MATKEGEEEEKQVDEEGGTPETILEGEKQERDPDEALIAEEAILSYVHEVMAAVGPQLQDAMESLSAHIAAEADATVFNDAGYLDMAGQATMDQIGEVFGGKDSPIAQAIMPDLSTKIDELMAAQATGDKFATDLGTACRDACWFVRDNIQGILASQWDQLRDLAYEGSTDFIPLIHQLGMPPMDTDSKAVAQPLMAASDEYKATKPQEKEEAAEKEGVEQEGEKAEVAEEQQEKLLADEEEKAALAV
jgi:hypothetical protein